MCGCSDPAACLGADGLPCAWIEPDLCTACAGTTASALVERLERASLMMRCAQLGANPELPGEPPAEFALAVRWADGSASSVGLAAGGAAALHRDAAERAARGEPPGLDELMRRAERSAG